MTPPAATTSRAELLNASVTRLFVALREHLVAQHVSVPQVRVLSAVRDRGPARVTDLATALQVTQPTMTAQVRRLAEQGWLRRDTDEHDGRAVRVTLTAAGRSALAALVASRARLLERGLDGLDDDERAAIGAALPALLHLAERVEQAAAPRTTALRTTGDDEG